MECKQLLPNEKIRISSTGQCISPAVVKEFEKNKIVIDTYYNEHLIVIEMEKIAQINYTIAEYIELYV